MSSAGAPDAAAAVEQASSHGYDCAAACNFFAGKNAPRLATRPSCNAHAQTPSTHTPHPAPRSSCADHAARASGTGWCSRLSPLPPTTSARRCRSGARRTCRACRSSARYARLRVSGVGCGCCLRPLASRPPPHLRRSGPSHSARARAPPQVLLSYARHPTWRLGFAADVGGAVLMLLALQAAPLSLARARAAHARRWQPHISTLGAALRLRPQGVARPPYRPRPCAPRRAAGAGAAHRRLGHGCARALLALLPARGAAAGRVDWGEGARRAAPAEHPQLPG